MQKNTKNRIVITGNLGFIFSHVTDYFLEREYEVHGIDNHGAGSHPELITDWEKLGYKHHEFDVSNSEVIELIKEINPEFLVHAAAYSDVDLSIKDPEFVVRNNMMGNLNMFIAALELTNLKKFLYINTDEIYGECKYRKEEDEILFPRNPYAIGKATGALMRFGFDNTFEQLKDKTCETRYCNVFGPRQDNRKIIPRIIDSLKTGEPMPVHNGGGAFREYIYVKNIPPIVELMLLKGTRTYNVTNNDIFTVNQIIKKIEDLAGKTVQKIVGTRPGMDMKYQMASNRLRSEFNWKSEWSFEDGLLELLKLEGLHD